MSRAFQKHAPAWLIQIIISLVVFFLITSATEIIPGNGLANLQEGEELFRQGRVGEAVPYFWGAILNYNGQNSQSASNNPTYSLQHVFGQFIRCFAIRGRLVDGYIFIVREALLRGQRDMAQIYIKEALAIAPQNEEVLDLKSVLDGGVNGNAVTSSEYIVEEDGKAPQTMIPQQRNDLIVLAEKKFNVGVQLFNQKSFQLAAAYFEEACEMSGGKDVFAAACTNAIYCRTTILDWGYNGTQFLKDMKRIEKITWAEVNAYRSGSTYHTSSRTISPGKVKWRKATSVHPHMVLSYPIDPMLKRLVSESHAFLDEPHARFDEEKGTLRNLPSHLPYIAKDRREAFKIESENNPAFKLKVGFVSSGFKSKAVLFLSHDMFRFFDRDQVELHIFSASAADDPVFIQTVMRGVDWRKRVKENVDHFHDIQDLKDDHIALAKMIYDLNIHVLIDWDGYARQGERTGGLFALRPAPLQILHQEFLGTMGGHFDYIVTDKITSPESAQDLYTEKFLYIPNHFFSKGHAIQAEVKNPTYGFKPKKSPYENGTGSPQENRCLSSLDRGPEKVSFVFCNFNKFLKNNPETMVSYIEILRNVPNSILCLLENPKDGIPNLIKFVKDVDSSPGIDDSDNLVGRIHFLPWAANPYDHQMRNQDFCNVVLDTYPYNSHTTAQDALYGGVPIVTRSDGMDMASRVSTSANVVLGLDDLNAYGGPAEYVEIATKLGTDSHFFNSIRTKLIRTCLQRDPLHPYWDVNTYVSNFQKGLYKAWYLYLNGDEAKNIET